MEIPGIVGWDIIWKKCPTWLTVISNSLAFMMVVFGGAHLAFVFAVRYVVV